ncbi:FHA domain-containing protein [Fervidobacterium sp. 2310opik-2]|uniref:FHA domain-containing protein n=1 Tax=Fervidobacterium sp. 2310opik-2 TaxID=1755815 RepID=UPI0013E061A9|nr:FHA domain-containing protein [Fervidobacterium sp. 2310opik-2]KAF2961322.1 hypothetical protein AS161_01895 [Fervidobacterium sp. 2310opik-2]
MVKVCKNCGRRFEKSYKEDFCECGGFLEPLEEKLPEPYKLEEIFGDIENSKTKTEKSNTPSDTPEELIENLINVFGMENLGELEEIVNKTESTQIENAQTAQSNQENLDIDKEELSKSYESITLRIFKKKNLIIEESFSLDEIIVGRSLFGVDVNLRKFDDEKIISRKHVKIVRENGKYYIVRLSKKMPMYLGDKLIKYNERKELKNGDRVILNRSFGIEIVIPEIN